MIDSLDRIRSLFRSAQERVLVISAFLSADILQTLLTETPGDVERMIFANWSAEDIASGASDWQAWDVAREFGAQMFACPALHAKIFVADGCAIVGSANATKSGLSGYPAGNLELLVEVDAELDDVADVIKMVQDASKPALPLGPDLKFVADDSVTARVWSPESDPETFLRAMKGEIEHNDETEKDRKALGLSNDRLGRSEIKNALRDRTAFRVVRHSFENRLVPMNQQQLRVLFQATYATDQDQLSDKDVNLLARWLGQFGENTHLTPSGKDGFLLAPGELLHSETHPPI